MSPFCFLVVAVGPHFVILGTDIEEDGLQEIPVPTAEFINVLTARSVPPPEMLSFAAFKHAALPNEIPRRVTKEDTPVAYRETAPELTLVWPGQQTMASHYGTGQPAAVNCTGSAASHELS